MKRGGRRLDAFDALEQGHDVVTVDRPIVVERHPREVGDRRQQVHGGRDLPLHEPRRDPVRIPSDERHPLPALEIPALPTGQRGPPNRHCSL